MVTLPKPQSAAKHAYGHKSKPVAGSQFLGGTPEKFSKGEVFIVKN